VVSTTDPDGRVLDFLDRLHCRMARLITYVLLIIFSIKISLSKEYGGSGCTDSHFLELGTRWM
jgi:hypothetical protein